MSLKNYLKIAGISLPLLVTPIASYASFNDFIRDTQERIEDTQEDIGRKYNEGVRKVGENYQKFEGDIKERGEEYMLKKKGKIERVL